MKRDKLKRLVLAYISFRFFLGGVEEFLILPTAWKYVSSLGGTLPLLGAVAAAYAIGVSFSSPLFGRLARKYRHVYFIMLMAAWVKFWANVLYSIPVSKFFPLFGRLMSGMADSCDGVIYDVASRYTDEVDRMRYALVFDGVFTLGAAFGAVACSSLVLKGNVFGWSQWSLGVGNSPGIILAGIWLVFLILTLCLPCTFGVDITSVDKGRTISSSSDLPYAGEVEMISNDDINISDDDVMTNNNSDVMTSDDDSDDEIVTSQKLQTTSPKWLDSRVACLLYLTFSTMFFSSFASLFPSLLAMQLFHLKVVHVKLLFVNATLTLIILFLLLSICARHFQERSLLAFLLSIQLPPLVILVVLTTMWDEVSLNNSILLLIYICFGLPYFGFSTCGSLLTKFIEEEQFNSIYQTVLIALVQIAVISSRLIAGFVFRRNILPYFSFALILMWLVGVIWFGFVFPKLKTQNRKYK